METISQSQQRIVEDALNDVTHIGTLPEITLKIIELVEDPESTASDLHKLISNDPALCSRVLKVVNSSFYGLPGQVGSIDRAIVMLGLNAVKNIAIAASLNKLFRGGSLTADFSARDLWEHSISTAATAKLLADAMGHRMGDEAFLAGLIHDIGIMVELQTGRHTLVEALERVAPNSEGAPAANLIEVETELFGADHQAFGAGLCHRWKFPRTLAVVTGFHHRPTEAPDEQRLVTCIIAAADRLAAEAGGGFRLDLPSLEIPSAVQDVIGLTDKKLNEIREQLPSELENTKGLLN